jgi:hypothetical protein
MKVYLIEFKLSEIIKVILNVDNFSGISHVDVAELHKLVILHQPSHGRLTLGDVIPFHR